MTTYGSASARSRQVASTCATWVPSGIASVTAGSTSADGPRAPTAGNSPRPKENTCTSSNPTQNTGSATPSEGSARGNCRSHRARVYVATSAVAAPPATASSSAAAASASVDGRASAIAAVTSWPFWIDAPKSPRSTARSRMPYWTTSGWSSP